jgi:hypothetical protein
MALPFSEMATAGGLDFYDDPAALNSKQGVLIGVRHGFFICAGAAGDSSRIGIIARFKQSADSAALLSALKQNETMKKMYTLWNGEVTGPQTVLWTFGKPMRFKKEDFAAAIEGFAHTVAQFATPFDMSKCETCGTTVQQMVLANGYPTLMCSGCQSRAEQENQAERQQYESSDSNLVKAFLYGSGAAILGAAIWAGLAYWDYDKGTYHPKLQIALVFLIGILVAWAVKHGAGRITVAACALAVSLTAVGKVAADILFFNLIIAEDQGARLGQELLQWSLANVWHLKWGFSPLVTVLDGVAVLAAAGICWGMRPKFALTLKTYPMPRSASRAAAAGASFSASPPMPTPGSVGAR